MRVLCEPGELREEVKRSRFICRVAPVGSEQEAERFLAQVREERATHNCWAYRVGEVFRSSDDGEPGGTAGRPILGAIDKQGFDGVVVVVTRYFGGIKLGAGGLVRAYGGIAARCLQQTPSREEQPTVVVEAKAPFCLLGAVRSALQRMAVEVVAEEYDARGVRLQLRVPEGDEAELTRALAEATSGQVTTLAVGEG
jgi:uncharacterized YigZ family protein